MNHQILDASLPAALLFSSEMKNSKNWGSVKINNAIDLCNEASNW